MARAGHVDYHIHYYLDTCADDTMRLPAIEATSLDMGLDEIGVLKHYSQAMPTGENDWAAWHVTDLSEFERYLREMEAYRPSAKMPIYSGVETELVNDEGEINIPLEAQEKIDLIALSVHYFPSMSCLTEPFLYHPVMQRKLLEETAQGRAAQARWREQVLDVGAEPIIEGLVTGYVRAIERYPKVRLLSHMYDGLLPLRQYHVAYDHLSADRLVALFEPLMARMASQQVLWELCHDAAPHTEILTRANEMGVRFVATADAHFFGGSSWGNFTDHAVAEAYIDSLSLTKGTLTLVPQA